MRMRIYSIDIQVVFESNDRLKTKTYSYHSPKKIISGIKMHIGWFFVRIGMNVFYHGMHVIKVGTWKDGDRNES